MTKMMKGNFRGAKLRPDQVLQLRRLYVWSEAHQRGMTQRELGELYDLSTNQVGKIVRNESWRAFQHAVTDEELESRHAGGPEPSAEALAESQARLFQKLGQPGEAPQPAEPAVAWADAIRRLHAGLPPGRSLELPVSPEKASILALRAAPATGVKDTSSAETDPRTILPLTDQIIKEVSR